VGTAKYFVAGQELELSGEDGQGKMIRAFGELIKHTYPNLKMLRSAQYSEAQIAEILTQAEQGLFGEETQLPEPQQEMLSFIQSNNRGGIRTTVKSLLQKFESKPYGWSFAAVLCTLAHLCGRAKVEVRESTNLLDDAELSRALRNTASHGNLILDPQVEFSQSQIRKVKEFYNDYFEKVAHATEVKALAKEVQEGFAEQAIELDKRLAQATQYPFLRALSPIVSELQELKSKPYTWFMSELTSQEDQWFDHKEKTIDPILKFMKGPNKDSFDEARKLLEDQKPNLEYVEGEEPQSLREALVEPSIYKGAAVQQLKADCASLQQKIETQIDAERNQAQAVIEALKAKLLGFEEFQKLEADKQATLKGAFDKVESKVTSQSLIAMIRDEARRFEDQRYASLVQQLMEWNQPEQEKLADPVESVEPKSPSEGQSSDSTENKVESKAAEEKQRKPATIPAKNIQVNFRKPWLADEADIDEYLAKYRDALLEEIKQGKKVQL
jgi:hypothetical protein